MNKGSSVAAQPGGSHLLVYGLGNIIERARKLAPSTGSKVVHINMTGASSKPSTAHRIIEAFLERQSDETLENPEFKKRLARACTRAEAGTFGKCGCGVSLSADLIVNGDALTEHCPACALEHANKRAEQFRQTMEGMKTTAARELEAFQRQSEELALQEGDSRKGGDEADRSTDDSPRKVLETLIANRTRQIESINGALARIEAGEYGVCEGCNEEIPIGRLKAVPFTRTCVRCKGA
jgi:DnaK suppressor protein